MDVRRLRTLPGWLILGLIFVHLQSETLLSRGSEDRLGWFKEAKFGMFIHWGPYSMLAGEWKGKRVPVGKNAEWIMHDLEIPAEEYRQLARRFNPTKFDARCWVKLAKDAGMKYLVITAKHHDGFAMYHSRVSRYNIVDWTRFGRDPLQELAAECRKAGIRFCVYYSHREDWNEPFAYGNTWDFKFDPEKDLSAFEKNYLDTKAKPQLRELLAGYGPLGLIWFDRGLYTPEQALQFAGLVKEMQPDCLVNGRVGHYGQELMGDYQNMSDNGMPLGGLDEYWETPQTLNETWGYSRFDEKWKSSETVIRRLVEVVSKGGNYLLNIGPTGEGVAPAPSVKILEEVGQWVRANGAAVYGTQLSPFQSLPWGRCTVKGASLYLHVFDWPKDRDLVVPGLRNEIRAAYPLLRPEQRIRVRRRGEDWIIGLPSEPISSADTVVVVELDGRPSVRPPVVSEGAGGVIELTSESAVTSGKAAKRFNRTGGFHIAKWKSPEDSVSWFLDVKTAGRWVLEIDYAAQSGWVGRGYVVRVDGKAVAAVVEPTGGWYEYRRFTLGAVDLACGRHSLTIQPETSGGASLMYLKSLRLFSSR